MPYGAPERALLAAAERVVRALAIFDVAFIRHGNTQAASVDIERVLSERGRLQCEAAASGYMRHLDAPLAPLALSSPAVRALETGRLLLGEDGPPPIIPLSQLYDDLLQPSSSAMFSRCGYAPLIDYFADSAESRNLLHTHARTTLDRIAEELEARLPAVAGDASPDRSTLCIFGHAMYLPATALRLATLRGHETESTELILNTNTQEASGFIVRRSASSLLLAGEVT